MSGDRLIRRSTVIVVGLVAAVAAVVSYRHALAVVNRYGETGLTAKLIPGTVDGIIYCSSMVLLYAARHRLDVPVLARWSLAVGILATLVMNLTAGLGHGVPGAVIAAWPAVALVLSYELMIWLIRASAADSVAQGDPGRATSGPQRAADGPPVPQSAEVAATVAYRASVAAGQPLSQRALAGRFGVSRRKAGQLVAAVRTEGNGHGHPA